MTKDEALKLALEALETKGEHHPRVYQAITAIKEALAQLEHGWTSERIAGMARLKEAQDKKLAQPEHCSDCGKKLGDANHIHTCSPQRTWVGLTDEDIALIDWESLVTRKDCVRAIEAAHGIKGEA
jgi:hypothetical protein